METIAIILFGVGCFALGMYVTTQISSWIDSRIQHKKFMKNLEDFDKKEKSGLWGQKDILERMKEFERRVEILEAKVRVLSGRMGLDD